MPEKSETVYGKGNAGGIWKSMLSEQIGAQIAKAGGIGIARMLNAAHPAAPAAAPADAANPRGQGVTAMLLASIKRLEAVIEEETEALEAHAPADLDGSPAARARGSSSSPASPAASTSPRSTPRWRSTSRACATARPQPAGRRPAPAGAGGDRRDPGAGGARRGIRRHLLGADDPRS